MKELERLDELELIKQCQRGEKQAFQALISFYYSFVSKYLLKLTGDGQLSEDLAQETFLRLIRSIDSYDIHGKASFSTYVMTIAKRLYIDHLRKNKRPSLDISGLEEMELDPGQDVEQLVMKGLQMDKALAELETLPPDQALAIRMKYLEYKTLDEIASQLHLQPKTVKSRIHNGMVKMRQAFSGGN